MSKKILVLVLFSFLFTSMQVDSQEINTVAEIRANAQTLQGVDVTIEGVVTKLVGEEQLSGGEYLLKGVQDVLIKISTSKPFPVVGIRYEIKGEVDLVEGEPIIIEERRIQREEYCRIEGILRNPKDYVNSGEIFAFHGEITQLDPKGTNSYFLKDEWGGIIKAKTTSLDDIVVGGEYILSGSIGLDEDIFSEEVFISEFSRSLQDIIPPKTFLEKIWEMIKKNWMIIAIVIIAIISIFVLISVLRHKEMPETIAEFEDEKPKEPKKPKKEEKGEVKLPEPEEVLEGTTLKMATPPSGTLKMLPGRLVVLQGEEKIKEIRFYKTKAEEENEITFGRAAGKPYAHIELKERTVSAKQAKIIYAGKKFTIINYGKTNPTRVNDVDLEENGMSELNDGDKIQMGEILFQFHLR